MTSISRGDLLANKRTCGSCYTCCIFLGIDELKKYATQPCSNLTGALGPDKRCSIYAQRPEACRRYNCAWIEGLLSDQDRPDKSGLLITPYTAHEGSNWSKNDPWSCTIIVTNPSLSGTLTSGTLAQAVDQILRLGCTDLRVISHASRSVIHFKDGLIRAGELHPQPKGEYESLVFETRDPPLGRYEIRNLDDD